MIKTKAGILILLSFLPLFILAQQKGRVIDASTRQPLAFVNIRYDQGKMGCSSDINGKFELPANHKIRTLQFTYVGYRDTLITLPSKPSKQPLVIELHSTQYALKEVIIIPGINPAHRIIENAIENRKLNNPEKLESFTYTGYHKMVFTADSQSVERPDTIPLRNSLDSTATDSVQVDSSEIKMQEFLDKQHLFMMESVSERKFLNGRSSEKVTGTRISGMQAPLFALLATQFQSFSFYKPLVDIGGQPYVNPISPGSTKKYFFRIEDTLYDQSDTVFIIAFRPLWGKNFDGLKGVLYIHSQQWAIQSVIAEPFEQSSYLSMRIEQLYEPVDSSGAWFPVQLNTRLKFRQVMLNRSALVGIGHTYLDDIQINPKIRTREFDHVVVEIDPNANRKDEAFWDDHRNDSLTSKEQVTYRVIDSIGETINADRWYKALQILSTGQIPMGKISADLDKFYQYNEYEKSRLGLGLRTNNRLWQAFFIHGYFAYGFGDKAWKYGGGADLRLNRRHDWWLKAHYKYDLEESAEQAVFERTSFLSTEFGRYVLRKEFVSTERFSIQTHFRALKHFRWEVGASHALQEPTNDYLFKGISGDVDVWQAPYRFSEMHAGFRFGFREKFIVRSHGLTSLGTKFPILQARYTQGFQDVLDGDFNYQKLDAQLDYSFNTRYIGKTSIRVNGGMISTALPWYQLYNGKGSYARFFVEAPFSFNTMRLNEFLSDRYAAAYLRHNFGNLLIKKKNFAPELIVASSVAIGQLQHEGYHRHIDYKTLDKPYFESGLIIRNLYRSTFSNLGFGVYYRYGEHAFDKVEDNFVFRLSTGFSF